LCDAAAPPPFLVRQSVPVHQNLPAATRAQARDAPLGRLEMVACDGCGFVFNCAFDPRLPRYGPGYDNAQSHSPAFAAHLDALARHLVEERGVRGARIVEVGCGRGDFLRRLVAWPGADNWGVGFDPACDEAVELGGRLRFERRFYGPECADVSADVVVCRHVIEHVADPLALLRAVRGAPRVFFETPDVDWILRNGVIWDFFYEHCSLFSTESLAYAFALAGFGQVATRAVFGGQYLWVEGAWESEPAPPLPQPPTRGGGLDAAAAAYGASEPERLDGWKKRLAALAAEGPAALWGAGAKGVTLAGLVDPAADLIDCLADINPAKQGRFVPGTGHPIVAPSALAARGVRNVVLMNPAYRAETLAMLPSCGNPRLAAWEE
jgi:SAM-dependent methyltransferase